MEEAVRESEERFKLVATNTPDHILVQDKDLRYKWVLNPRPRPHPRGHDR